MAQALPPGWEARFDPGSGRYYFINHYTKTTSWVDPRGAVQPKPQVQFQLQPQRQTAGYSQPSLQPAARQPTQSSISDTLQRPSQTPRSLESIELRSPSQQESPVQSSQQETSLDTDDDSGLSEAEKRAMAQKLRGKLDLEGVNDDLIVMTLQGVSYDEEMAIDVFRSMGFKGKGESSAESSSSADRWETTTTRPKKTKEIKPSQPILPSQPSQPISMPSDISTEPLSSADNSFDFNLNERVLGSGNVLDHMSSDQSADLLNKMTAAADVSVQGMFSKASTSNFDALKSNSLALPSSSYKLQDKLGSSGPNVGLSYGSNSSLLSNQRMKTIEANPKLASGPHAGLAQGQSMLAKGQNKSLAHGADRSLHVGRNVSLAKGPQRAS